MATRPPKRIVELTDPRALRALAHPTRLELVGLLRREGPLTATQAAEKVGESPSSCSFHLRQLAKWGLVEEAGGGRGRERPWRATARYTSWDAAAPEAAGASAALSSLVARRQLEELLAWYERAADEPPEWRTAAQWGDTLLALTPAELEELDARVAELVRSYERDTAPEGSRPVVFFYAAHPQRVDS
ncbi:MAG TPA: winged helix-turn-helix domain-containing protein [Gaiellaceae bacterium]|jgi:predicted ArsR family transcriptional regulator|nr:winged helix-turn-helix domain-containing protein [Gaiellaceae bacterium]